MKKFESNHSQRKTIAHRMQCLKRFIMQMWASYENWYAVAPGAPIKWSYVSHGTKNEYITTFGKQKILRGPKSQEVTYFENFMKSIKFEENY